MIPQISKVFLSTSIVPVLLIDTNNNHLKMCKEEKCERAD